MEMAVLCEQHTDLHHIPGGVWCQVAPIFGLPREINRINCTYNSIRVDEGRKSRFLFVMKTKAGTVVERWEKTLLCDSGSELSV